MKMLMLVGGISLLLALPASAQSVSGPDLDVTKTCTANGAQSILCTVTVTNIGGAPTLAPLTVADTPTAPAGSTYTGAGGSLPIGCALGAGPVLPIPCTANISLQPGQSETALFSFRVPDGGRFSNCVTVTIPRNAANPGDLHPANNTNICTSLGGGNGNGGGDDGKGSVTFVKTVINRTRHPTPSSFDIQYQCQPDMSTVVNLSLTAPGYQQAVAVARGAECKFTEVTPVAPKGCKWIVSYPKGQYGKDGDRLVVQNELSCEGGGGGGDDPKTCPAGQSLVTFPGSDVKYCCNGKPGSDKFCCNVVREAKPLPGKR